MKSRNTAWTDPSFEQITETFIHEYLEERKTLVSQLSAGQPAGNQSIPGFLKRDVPLRMWSGN